MELPRRTAEVREAGSEDVTDMRRLLVVSLSTLRCRRI